jgi:hypothetical protein
MATIPTSAKGIVPKTQDFKPIPANDEYGDPTVLNVEVEGCDLREINEDFRKKYNVEATHEFSFKFKVIDGEFRNRRVWGNAQALWYEGNCRLRLWTKAILGVDDFPPDYQFDSDHVIGHSCRVTIKNYKKRDGSLGESVLDVRPVRPDANVASGSTSNVDEYEPF